MNDEEKYSTIKHKDHVYLTWNDYTYALSIMIDKIKDSYMRRNPSGVYGIPRGGLPLAVSLSNLLKLPMLMCPAPNCLIVDDILDRGRQSMPLIKRHVLKDKAIILFWYCNVERLKNKITNNLDNIYWVKPMNKGEHYHFPWGHLRS